VLVSVLDTQSPAHLPELLPELDRLGFHRYWATEHHSETQSASPTIVASLAAGITDHIRVGTAGVLLRATSALRVVEDFATLELFFPGRIDLGIAGATPPGDHARSLERDLPLASDGAYAERLTRLVEMVRSQRLPGGGGFIGPRSDSRPELWLCGTSERAARLAGTLGISFAYHHYLASADQRIASDVADAYRSSFVGFDEQPPRLLVAAYGHCASSDDQATTEWNAYFGHAPPKPSFVGTPEQVAAQLAVLSASYAADELAIDCFAPTFDARLDALAKLKSALDSLTGATALEPEDVAAAV